jgi:hypothetical protein
MYLCTI